MTLFYLAFQNTTTPSNTPYYWNSFTTVATSVAASLVDSAGNSLPLSVSVSSTSGIVKNSNGLNVAGSGDAAWVNQAAISDETWTFSNSRTMTLGGLDNAKRYTIAFFGSQDGAGTNDLSVTIGGVNKVLNTSNNSTQIIEFIDIAPSSSAISISIIKATNNCRLCAMRIDEHVYNPYVVDTITDPVEIGGTLSFTTTGFATLTAITTDQTGITVSGITGVDGSADVDDWQDGEICVDLPAAATYTFTDGTNSALIEGDVTIPSTYTRVVAASPALTVGYLAGDILAQTGRTFVSGDVFNHTSYDDFELNPDTGYTVTSEGVIDLWVRVAAGSDAGKMYYYSVSIVINSGGLTSAGLTSIGLTRAGLTSSGL